MLKYIAIALLAGGLIACQQQHRLNNKKSATINTYYQMLFDQGVQFVLDDLERDIVKEIDLSPTQQAHLTDIKNWEALIKPKRQAVLAFIKNKPWSREERRLLLDCIQTETVSAPCVPLFDSLDAMMWQQIKTLVRPLGCAMTQTILDSAWIPLNATPENCALLRSGSFTTIIPYTGEIVYIERQGSKQSG